MTMQQFIGVKVVKAQPFSRKEFESYRGLPTSDEPDQPGYLVEYQNGGKPNDNRHEGYISWSPKSVFDQAYRQTDGMSFGLAIEALKKGLKVARAGWNGKGMWLVLVPGTPQASLKEGTPYRKALGHEECEILPHIDMWTINAEGRRAMLPGWVASQTDKLADDWVIVE